MLLPALGCATASGTVVLSVFALVFVASSIESGITTYNNAPDVFLDAAVALQKRTTNRTIYYDEGNGDNNNNNNNYSLIRYTKPF